MCLAHRNIRDYDPKTRRIWAWGNFCLFTGASLMVFADGIGHRHPNFFLALRGFFMGMAVVFLFWSSRRMRSFGPRN